MQQRFHVWPSNQKMFDTCPWNLTPRSLVFCSNYRLFLHVKFKASNILLCISATDSSPHSWHCSHFLQLLRCKKWEIVTNQINVIVDLNLSSTHTESELMSVIGLTFAD